MDDDIKIHMYEEADLRNSMLIDGFPTIGLVSTIVSSFIIDQLKLRRIGAIVSKRFPSASIISNGVPSPPLRIYAGPKLCGPENECDQVVVLTSEVRIPEDMQLPLANRILDWADEQGVRMVLSIEGTPIMEEPDPEKDLGIFGTGSTEKARKLIKRYELSPMEMGIITGVAGNLLYLGDMRKRDVLCLLAPAHSQFPDARAGAKMIEVIDQMLPVIEIDTSPLLEEATRIERQIQDALALMKKGMESGSQQELPPTSMYR